MAGHHTNKAWNRFEEGLAVGMKMGTVGIPFALLTEYAKLDLTETDVMLLIHLIAFTEKENKWFPTMEELEERMSIPSEDVIESLQKLMKAGFVTIDEKTDPLTGVLYEQYNLDGMWRQLAALCTMEMQHREGEEGAGADDIYSIFEQEFGRPLTPMEMETITGWLDEDRYPEALILEALKEAVFAGKVHFRYIDRILLEWKRNKIYTPEQARQYAERFRG